MQYGTITRFEISSLSLLDFVCEFGGERSRGLWREGNREKIKEIFYIF
jgi:hypothetical protein